jgi:hypothetical protein
MSRIQILEGSASVDIVGDEFAHDGGVYRVDYRPADLLRATLRALVAMDRSDTADTIRTALVNDGWETL